MDGLTSSDDLLFAGFRFDRRGGALYWRDAGGSDVPVLISSRAIDMLGVLVAQAGEVVSRDEIISAVWRGRVIEDSNLTVQVSALRRVLDRGRPEGSCIQTVPGRGYRFVAPVTRPGPRSGPPASPFSTGVLISAPRLSIVVLPFTNLSEEPQQYLSDGITDDLITDLARLPHVSVISRNTAFTYANRPVNTKQIGRDLGVRYVLEGSVRRSDDRVRVNAQLIDVETDAHLWAERYECHAGALFEVQDDITGRIAAALHTELIAAEAARPIEHADVLDYMLRGRAAVRKPISPESYTTAIEFFERALSFDPQSAEAQSRLACSLACRALVGMADSSIASLARAEALVGRALTASPRSAFAHFAKGCVLRAQYRWEEAVVEHETALELNNTMVGALNGLGWCKLFLGSIDEVIELQEQANRLGPRDLAIAHRYELIGTVHLLQSRTDAAIVWLEKARSALPAVPWHHSGLASAYALLGETERAIAELAEARSLNGGDLYSSIADVKAGGGWQWFGSKFRSVLEATYLAGLRKAGMPEE